MAKILEFQSRNTEDGYKYFAKAVLDSLCKGEPDADDLLIQIEDSKGKIHEICGAQLDREAKTVFLQMED